LPQRAVMIDAGKAEVLDRRGPQRGEDLLGRGLRIERAVAHAIEQVSDFGNGHKS
jgi:hypothetical protein